MLKLQSDIASSKKVVPVILCGGVGKRVWPLSSDKMPKQFLKIESEHSSLQETIKHFTSNCFKKPIIMTALQYETFVEQDLLELEVDYEIIFLEENQRNTAMPSILAGLYIEFIYGDALMLIAPSDHYISPNFAMNSVIEQAIPFTEDSIVIFGIKPNSPSTEYGYIRVGNIIKHDIAYEVKSFKEKPDIESAISYIQSGEYFWNSGYFLVKASKYLSVIYDLEPEILRYCKEVFADKVKNKIYNLRAINTEYVKSSINRLQRMNVAYENIECLGAASSKSIDEILSKSSCELMTMVELKEIEWADLGSWKSRFEVSKKDAKNNFIAGNVLADQVQSSYIVNQNDEMIVTLGVENLIVINTKGAVLIADKDQYELIKKNTTIARQIQFVENSIGEYSLERRPWRHYRVLYSYAGYVVKQIVILPMEEISLQKHLLRSEHWVVVSGRGAVENESVLKEVVVDDYLYIAKSAVHRIRNTSEVEELKIIEAQIGVSRESDIVRLSDKYGRK